MLFVLVANIRPKSIFSWVAKPKGSVVKCLKVVSGLCRKARYTCYDLLRSAFMNKIADVALDPNMLMFVDEAAKDDRTFKGLEDPG